MKVLIACLLVSVVAADFGNFRFHQGYQKQFKVQNSHVGYEPTYRPYRQQQQQSYNQRPTSYKKHQPSHQNSYQQSHNRYQSTHNSGYKHEQEGYGNPHKHVKSSVNHKVSCIGLPDGTLIGDINTHCKNFFSCFNQFGIVLTCPAGKKFDSIIGACAPEHSVKCSYKPVIPIFTKATKTTTLPTTITTVIPTTAPTTQIPIIPQP